MEKYTNFIICANITEINIIYYNITMILELIDNGFVSLNTHLSDTKS